MHKTLEILHGALQLHGAGTYAAPQGQNYPPHQHTIWELVYYRTGQILCPVGQEIYESQPGMLLLTPPGTIHAEYALTAYSNYHITIDAPIDQPWPRLCLDDAQHSFGYICGQLVREWNSQTQERDQLLILLVKQFDILLRRAQEQQQIPEAELLVRKIEHLIGERFSTQLTIKDLAREIGISTSHLRAQFVHLRGQAPQAYLQSIRLKQALSMLSTSNSSLSTIALRCGYDSASHLSRHVKRATGKTPGAYRSGALSTQ